MANANKRVLIVEDAPDIQRLLTELLTGEGYGVEVARNGREALEVLRAAQDLPGVILLDLMMPVMDGYEFRKEQERDPRIADIPVIVMTADGDFQVKGLKVGAKMSLKKPFANLDMILSAVKRELPSK